MTSVASSSLEAQALLAMHSVAQSAQDVRHQTQKAAACSQILRNNLFQLAKSVFNNRPEKLNTLREKCKQPKWGQWFCLLRDHLGKVLAAQLSLTLQFHGLKPTRLHCPWIFQARILEWVAFWLFRGSSQPKDQSPVSCTEGRFFTTWATKEGPGEINFSGPIWSWWPARPMGTRTGLVFPVWIEGMLERGCNWWGLCNQPGNQKQELPRQQSDSGSSATDDFAIRRLKWPQAKGGHA